MTNLNDYGAGVEAAETSPDAQDDSDEQPDYSQRCVALKDDGERCRNDLSHMHPEPVCGPHKQALPVEGVCYNSDCSERVTYTPGTHEAYCSDQCAREARVGDTDA